MFNSQGGSPTPGISIRKYNRRNYYNEQRKPCQPAERRGRDIQSPRPHQNRFKPSFASKQISRKVISSVPRREALYTFKNKAHQESHSGIMPMPFNRNSHVKPSLPQRLNLNSKINKIINQTTPTNHDFNNNVGREIPRINRAIKATHSNSKANAPNFNNNHRTQQLKLRDGTESFTNTPQKRYQRSQTDNLVGRTKSRDVVIYRKDQSSGKLVRGSTRVIITGSRSIEPTYRKDIYSNKSINPLFGGQKKQFFNLDKMEQNDWKTGHAQKKDASRERYGGQVIKAKKIAFGSSTPGKVIKKSCELSKQIFKNEIK